MATETPPTKTSAPAPASPSSTISQKARKKLASIEAEAKTAALSAVNKEKSWLAQNWKQLAGIALLLLALAYAVHKL